MSAYKDLEAKYNHVMYRLIDIFREDMQQLADCQKELVEARGLLSIAYQLLPDYHDPELVKRHNEIKNYLFPPKEEV